ncbi:DUF2782 domain-containing protein [Ferrovum sp. PN-J185]|uniref:DUF2782 domain-containing protein n=1 Tax=Ferrovum sp. PN-J185 TaxID=1356306 RepID=UPI000799D1F7|nr:DUF2782 domain-containing protein [Ferrovum sp. PN-J185]KXW55536.1 hypothetical protein FV185_13040 [Ferrovum sp. PN-J185]
MTYQPSLKSLTITIALLALMYGISYAADTESFKDAPPPPQLNNANTKEVPPPPQYAPSKDNTNDRAEEPQVTIVERNGATFEETRLHGKLYKIKVTPKVGKPYYLIDEEGKGEWHRYDGPVDRTVVPQWVILKF